MTYLSLVLKDGSIITLSKIPKLFSSTKWYKFETSCSEKIQTVYLSHTMHVSMLTLITQRDTPCHTHKKTYSSY